MMTILCALYKLSINFEKAKYMLILPPQTLPYHYYWQHWTEDDVEYQGVYTDKHLNWQP